MLYFLVDSSEQL